MEKATIIGIDLAKRVFQVHGAAQDGRPVFRKKVSRAQLLGFLAKQSPAVVAMEACATAHGWGRAISGLGHEVRLIPPIYVKPFVRRQKNDAADAEAIAEAASRPTMRFVVLKTEEQQARSMIFRTRDLLVRQRTQLVNALRGHLAEHGIVAAQGLAKVKVLAARGMTVREIQGHLRELYAVDVSPDLISRVTDAVLDEVREWQNRPLDTVYPVVFFDALRVKIRDESVVRNKAVYLALALDCEGHKHVLGLWIEQSEGAKFWLRVMNELKNRGVEDIIFAVVDGLKGFPDAIAATFPRTTVQTCIVHLIRNSLSFVSWQDRKQAPAGTAGDLPGRDGRGGRAAARRLRSRVGQEVSRHRSGLATSLDRGHPILRLSATDQEDDLHHQRHRESASGTAQDHQDPRRLPVGRSRHQTTLSGAEESRRSLEACHRVARRLRPVRHLLCRAFAYYNPLITTRHGTLAHS